MAFHEVLIVGGGFGGIGMAITLKRAGIDDFLILERGTDAGGVWRDNTYPGAACDVPSHLYSFSFEPNPGWSRTFASQGEIHAYLRHCVRKYGLASHLRCRAEVGEAAFDEAAGLWRVRLLDGTALDARIVVTATGLLSNPALPRIEGLDSFRGPAFHSARWDHGVELAGKRVAVIGTGASATQFVPAIAPAAGKLTVFQRSPAWIIPRPDRPYSGWRKSLFEAWPWITRSVASASCCRAITWPPSAARTSNWSRKTSPVSRPRASIPPTAMCTRPTSSSMAPVSPPRASWRRCALRAGAVSS